MVPAAEKIAAAVVRADKPHHAHDSVQQVRLAVLVEPQRLLVSALAHVDHRAAVQVVRRNDRRLVVVEYRPRSPAVVEFRLPLGHLHHAIVRNRRKPPCRVGVVDERFWRGKRSRRRRSAPAQLERPGRNRDDARIGAKILNRELSAPVFHEHAASGKFNGGVAKIRIARTAHDNALQRQPVVRLLGQSLWFGVEPLRHQVVSSRHLLSLGKHAFVQHHFGDADAAGETVDVAV